MATDYNEQLENSIASECKLTLASGRVANFAYTDTAYACDNVAGTANYNFSQDQNIPLGNAGVLNTTSDILAKGVRSQASSLTRMMLNHFYGRTSYNVNKLADHLLSLFRTVKNFIKENDTAWSATTEYDVGDLVYFVTTLNGKKYKRTFFCIQSCLNLPPIDSSTESVINTAYWSEISGNVVSLSASESIRAKQGIIEQDLVVHGNLFVDGNTTTTTETQVASTGNYLTTRENNSTPLASNEYSGLAVNNYDAGKMATLTADHCGEWRVSDSATVGSTVYNNVSVYNGVFYNGLTRDVLATYPSHVLSNVSMLEMVDVVDYNGSYYKKEAEQWYGAITFANNALNKGELVTDSALIEALNALTPSSLVYYITVTDNEIDASSNQPLLTRNESSCFNNGDLLMWDSENRRAVKVTSPSSNNQKLVSCIDSVTGCLSYAWTDASAVDNATCFAGCTYACAMADFRDYTPSCATSATCFAGCTYACAMADFRDYTPSCATSATYSGSADAVSVIYDNCLHYGNDSLVFARSHDSQHGSEAASAHYLVSNYGCGETNGNFTLREPFNEGHVPQYSRLLGGTQYPWHDFITDENIRAQTVCYASGATCAYMVCPRDDMACGSARATISCFAGLTKFVTLCWACATPVNCIYCVLNRAFNYILGASHFGCNTFYSATGTIENENLGGVTIATDYHYYIYSINYSQILNLSSSCTSCAGRSGKIAFTM